MWFRRYKKIIEILLPLILLLAGLYLIPIKIFENDFSRMPGDLGDPRFNNYILEHGHKYITGKIDKYWDAPFMYPYSNVIALSDNLLGTLPIYSAFRLLGMDRETAFQFWFLSLFILNFICCFWALKKWSNNIILSATGSYIYAFSIFIIGQIGHAQVFSRFIIPLVFYWCWKLLTEKQIKYFIYSCLGIVYQFYCGIYLGFLLIYVLIFMIIAYFIVYRDWTFFFQFKKIRRLGYYLITIVGSALLLVPLMLPYIEISKITGTRHFEEAITYVPRLRSYFFASPSPIIWNFLYKYSAYSFPNWWNHFLFPGALPWIGIITIPAVLLSRKIESSKKKFIIFLFLGFFLSFIFCLNINGFTLFRIIYALPGFSSMRSIDRVINTEIIYFILIFVFVFKELSTSNNRIKWIVMAFPVLIIIDNLMNPQEFRRYYKHDSQLKIEEVRMEIKNQFDSRFAAIAFMPVNLADTNADERFKKSVENNLTVMLAAQELNIPCVNAYSGFNPGNYVDFFYDPYDKTLDKWCEFSKADITKIDKINNINKKEKSRIYINLKAYNGKFVCADDNLNNIVVANKEKPDSWETFLLIRFQNDECILRSHTNQFFCAELDKQGYVTATRQNVGEWETFTFINIDNNLIAFKAANGKYLSVDEKSNQLIANADTIGLHEKFELIGNGIK